MGLQSNIHREFPHTAFSLISVPLSRSRSFVLEFPRTLAWSRFAQRPLAPRPPPFAPPPPGAKLVSVILSSVRQAGWHSRSLGPFAPLRQLIYLVKKRKECGNGMVSPAEIKRRRGRVENAGCTTRAQAKGTPRSRARWITAYR